MSAFDTPKQFQITVKHLPDTVRNGIVVSQFENGPVNLLLEAS